MSVVDFYTSRGWRVTSPFGMRRHPITGSYTMHNGIDFGGKSAGEPIPTPYAGRVSFVGFLAGRGNTVAVKSANTGLLLIFQHLNAFRVKRGDSVKTGDIVGTNGATGDVTGPHLHFEIRHDNGSSIGSPVWGDPATYRDAAPKPGAKTYAVQSGDALWRIAQAHGVTTQDLVSWNKSNYPSLATDPGLIRVGWVLYVSASVVTEYTVKSGDVFWRIAQAHNLSTDELIAANPQIPDPGKIYPGQIVYIPAASPVEEETACRCDELKAEILELNKNLSEVEKTKNALSKSMNVIKSEVNKF